MSYEICVFDPAYAADFDAAHTAWDQSSYWDVSRPDGDRSAHKWRVKEALLAFDGRLGWKEPEAPKSGFLAKIFSKPAPEKRCLHLYVAGGDEATTLDVFDQAVEINLPWYAKRDEAETLVRDLWRFLEHLSRSGWTTLYDTERNVLLDLATDFEAVLARYIKNLDFEDVADAPARAGGKASASAPEQGTQPSGSFTGNLDEEKSWWKR